MNISFSSTPSPFFLPPPARSHHAPITAPPILEQNSKQILTERIICAFMKIIIKRAYEPGCDENISAAWLEKGRELVSKIEVATEGILNEDLQRLQRLNEAAPEEEIEKIALALLALDVVD